MLNCQGTLFKMLSLDLNIAQKSPCGYHSPFFVPTAYAKVLVGQGSFMLVWAKEEASIPYHNIQYSIGQWKGTSATQHLNEGLAGHFGQG